MKKIIYTALAIILFFGSVQNINTVSADTQLQQNSTKAIATAPVSSADISVNPLDVVKTPQKYLNKNVTMTATFDKFSTLGLDYKPAMRSSEEYIGILIKRDDIIDHTVPLSEMKMFLKRDLAEKNINLEAEDKIEITGKVFSTALGDPWIDIKEIKVLQKANKTNK